jgi:hypothetical protein
LQTFVEQLGSTMLRAMQGGGTGIRFTRLVEVATEEVMGLLNDPDKLAEAEHCAEQLVGLGVSPLFATSVLRTITARVALARRDFTRAETDGQAAR